MFLCLFLVNKCCYHYVFCFICVFYSFVRQVGQGSSVSHLSYECTLNMCSIFNLVTLVTFNVYRRIFVLIVFLIHRRVNCCFYCPGRVF